MSTPGRGTGESYQHQEPQSADGAAHPPPAGADGQAHGQDFPAESPDAPPYGANIPSYGQQQYGQSSWEGDTGYGQPHPGPRPAHSDFQYAQPGFPPPAAQPFGAYGYPPYEDPYAKSRLAAGLLGILLGWLGVHRFYLGYVGIGIVQIVVTFVTLGFGGIWGLIEGILYLTARTGTYSVDATGRPLRS